MRQRVVGRQRVEGVYQVRLGLWLMLRIRAVQMDKIIIFLGIRGMDRVPNARIRGLCGMAKG